MVQIGTVGHSINDDIIDALKAWADRNYKKSVKYIHKVLIIFCNLEKIF